MIVELTLQTCITQLHAWVLLFYATSVGITLQFDRFRRNMIAITITFIRPDK